MNSLLKTPIIKDENLRIRFEAFTESQRQEHAKARADFVYLYGEKRRARVELDFLEILRFPLMLDRYEKIAEAHKNTSLWIFKDLQAYQKLWDNFSTWFSDSAGIYWL